VVAAPLTVALLIAGCSGGAKSNAGAGAAARTTTLAGSTPAATSPSSSAASSNGAGGAAGGGGAAGVSACTLATAADVSTAYGEAFDPGKATTVGGDSSCTFTQSGGGVDTVGLVVATGGAADTFYSGNHAVYSGSDVSGLGDKAFVSSDGGEVIAETGSTAISVHLIGFETDTPAALQAKQKAFAQVVVGHIK